MVETPPIFVPRMLVVRGQGDQPVRFSSLFGMFVVESTLSGLCRECGGVAARRRPGCVGFVADTLFVSPMTAFPVGGVCPVASTSCHVDFMALLAQL